MSYGAKSCLLMLVIYALLCGVNVVVLQTWTPVNAYVIPFAMVMAIFSSLFFGSVVSVFTTPDESARVKAFLRGETEDGALGAVCGRIVSGGEALTAPISETAAVTWDCTVFTMEYSSVSNQSNKVAKYRGIARQPFACETSRGNWRIQGLVDLEAVPAQEWRAEKVWSALQEWSQDSRFLPFEHHWKGLTGYLEEFAGVGDDDCRLRHNPAINLTPEHKVEEKILRPGQEVCFLGVFDRTTQSLRGENVLGVERVRVFPGSPKKVIAHFRRKNWIGLAAMAILFLASHGLVGALLFWGNS